ncbi:MAG TPA: CYCXC family (seleno)protein [Longimicrobiales bacterium]
MSQRKPSARAPQRRRRDAMLYAAAAICVMVAALVIFARRANATEHPAPRAEAGQMMTKNADDFADPDTREVYKLAAQVKSTLDGLFCYCYCKGAGHYSLLDCFKDEHGAGCDICKQEARLAYQMTQQGATLAQIRAAIDAQFGPSS